MLSVIGRKLSCHRRRGREGLRVLPRGKGARGIWGGLLMGLCVLALVAPLVSMAALSIEPAPAFSHETSGFVPRSGDLLIFESATKLDPTDARPAAQMAGASSHGPVLDGCKPVGHVRAFTSLPTDFRLFFLLPIFNSKYK